MAGINRLPNSCLEHRHFPSRWRTDNVGASSFNLSNALLNHHKLVAQQLDLLLHDCRELLKSGVRLSELDLPRGNLLLEGFEFLLMLEPLLPTPSQLDLGDSSFLTEARSSGHRAGGQFNALSLKLDHSFELGQFICVGPDCCHQSVPLRSCPLLLGDHLAHQ
jgi:hypothetical protein